MTLERIMLLDVTAPLWKHTHVGVNALLKLREELARRPNPEQWIQASEAELKATVGWASSSFQIARAA